MPKFYQSQQVKVNMLKSNMEIKHTIWFNTITHRIDDLRTDEIQPKIEKHFEEIAGTKRKYYMDLRSADNRSIYTDVIDPSLPNEKVKVLIKENTKERLPYRFYFSGNYNSGEGGLADYDENNQLKVLRIGLDAPNSPAGSLEYLPVFLPVVEFEFYDEIKLNIWENFLMSNSLVSKTIPELTSNPTVIDRSPLVFAHGDVTVSISSEKNFIQVYLTRPDNVKIVCVVPNSIPQLDFRKIVEGDCDEWLKLPTNNFSIKYFDGDSEINTGIKEQY